MVKPQGGWKVIKNIPILPISNLTFASKSYWSLLWCQYTKDFDSGDLWPCLMTWIKSSLPAGFTNLTEAEAETETDWSWKICATWLKLNLKLKLKLRLTGAETCTNHNEATWRWCEPTCLCLEPPLDLEPCDLSPWLWPLTLTIVTFDLEVLCQIHCKSMKITICDIMTLTFLPMTFTFTHDLDRIKLHHHTKFCDSKSIASWHMNFFLVILV